MPRPQNKQQLLDAAQMERDALEELLGTLTPEQMTEPRTVGEWAFKDVLTHLIEWEEMAMLWYETGRKGKTPAVPSEKYNWAQQPQLNREIYLNHCAEPLPAVLRRFKSSYTKIMKIMESIPEKELFTPGQYAWTRKNLLAAYFVSATSSHYRWARTEIRKSIRKGK